MAFEVPRERRWSVLRVAAEVARSRARVERMAAPEAAAAADPQGWRLAQRSRLWGAAAEVGAPEWKCCD